jgi:hypothetical protein
VPADAAAAEALRLQSELKEVSGACKRQCSHFHENVLFHLFI